MITLLKLLDGSWEKARGYLRLDLDAIQSALNTRWAAVFTNNNFLNASTIDGDSTIDSVYVSNQGTGHTPLWDKVNLANGVQGRLAFAHLVEATQPGVLVGRRSNSAGDFEQITPGTGLAIHGTALDAVVASLVGSLPGSAPAPQDVELQWPLSASSTLPLFTTGSVVFAGPSGLLSQDNTNLFWDDTNNFLGLGTATPLNRLEVVGGGARILGDVAAAVSGAGLELRYTTQGIIQAYDRAAAVYKNLTFIGASLVLRSDTGSLELQPATEAVVNGGNFRVSAGTITASGYIRAGAVDSTAPASGDLVANRGGAPGSGVVFFGGSANLHYLYYDGTNFNFVGAPILITDGQLKVNGALTPFTVALGIQGVGANAIDVQNASGATANIYLSPSRTLNAGSFWDRWIFGAGQINVNDFGIGNSDRGTTPFSISGGATGGQALLQSAAGVQLQFMGTTASFPALKRSSATLQVRLADDSDYANFSMGGFQTLNQSGAGNVGFELIRTGGTALDWILYGKPGTTSLALYNGSDRFTFSGAGILTYAVAALTDHLEIGSTVSATGAIRLPNNTVGITTRNAADTGDIGIFTTDASDDAVIGFSNVVDIIFKPQNVQKFTIKSTGVVELVERISAYKNITTVSNGVPSELATVDSTGLTANVGATTLYTVPASGEGLYRVSAYVVETTAGSISSTLPNVQVVFTDKDSNTSVTLDVTPVIGAAGLGETGALTANTVGTLASGAVPIYVKASTTIQYQTVNYASNAAGMTYALHLKLEAL